MSKPKTTAEVRQQFIQYFRDNGHTEVTSSPVVPHDDPTLLFVNAGMNQFKDVFLGKSRRDYTRAVTSQKCIRAGGKHNDLENVGHTARHLVFFEMLGNFSFGDYFKKEAIRLSWEVSTKVFGFDPDRIWPSVFREDDEAYELWKAYVPEERITRMDEADNFWSMGDTGPCGPCSELYYDMDPSRTDLASPAGDEPGERFLEYWNLVFMQFNRDESGTMHPLPRPSIDTGAGLERIMQLIQGVHTVFDTDGLRQLIAGIEKVLGKQYDPNESTTAPAFRVIADHIRALAFSIADGSQPSNTERGYVLRKILRRAVRYGRQLAQVDEPFLAKLMPTLIEIMGEAYPELKAAQERICELLTQEEEGFLRTLRRGKNLMEQVIKEAKQTGTISGEHAFKLKDTYGFPLDEIMLIAIDQELKVDTTRYEELEAEARERSRQAHKATKQIASENLFEEFDTPCHFVGFDSLETESTVTALVVNGQFVDHVEAGEEALLVLDKTSFYAEKGGQVGDRGTISNAGTSFTVFDTQEPFNGVIAHSGKVEGGRLQLGETVTAQVDADRRHAIVANHTATHLLHWALQQVLGDHVVQAGSVVDADRLRFDFSHHKGVSAEEMRQIEDMVNAKIRENCPVEAYELAYDDVQSRQDIKQFFGDKYGATVRVVDIDFSKELCGGTHAKQTGDIGYFRIAKEGSISAGVRRIEAVTGAAAETLAREFEDALETVAKLIKSKPDKAVERIEKLVAEAAELQRTLRQFRQKQIQEEVQNLVASAQEVKSVPVIAQIVEAEPGDLKGYADAAMDKLPNGVLALGTSNGTRCQVLVRVGDTAAARGVHAGNLVKALAPQFGGKGGGKAASAQAGGDQPENLSIALEGIFTLVAEQIEQG